MSLGGHRIGILDYGTGNLRSVEKAFFHLGANVKIITSPDNLAEIDALVFPGQGTFDQCMEALEEKGFSVAIKEWFQLGKPFLGVCLGLQALFERSEEGQKPGLGILPGYVKKICLGKKIQNTPYGLEFCRMGKFICEPDYQRIG